MKVAKRAICLAAAMIMALSLVACGGKGLVGTWTATEDGITVEFVFNKDGTGSMNMSGVMSVSYKYTTDGDKLVLTIEVLGQSESQNYTYKLDGDKLEMTDESGVTAVFSRK